MMMSQLISLFCAGAYIASAILLFTQIRGRKLPASKAFLGLFISAIVLHGISLRFSLFAEGLLNLSFYKASSLIFLMISIISLLSLLRRLPFENILMVFLPTAALSVIAAQWIHIESEKMIGGYGMISHIVLSLLAYSLITMAALQAVALAIQERHIKRHEFNGLFSYLPPLQAMEALLFSLTYIGFALLSAAIASGFFFLNDMFAQHLVHKTSLSITAWLLFAILVFGRQMYGWRGQTAAKLTIAGFIALMLAYFGSKLVLELILQAV